jgi:ABC-type Co2+ transport system permease subunit
MHIEPGVVEGAKLTLGYVTAGGAMAYTAKLAIQSIKQDGISAIVIRSLISALLVFSFFEVLPHYAVGVSEVHLILGSTLFLIFGAAPAAIGLAVGLLVQGLFFAPADLPQYGMNVTSLLVPLLAVSALAHRIIPANTAYQDVSYKQALSLSTAFQGGVISWVGFWAIYGQGFAAENLANVATFGGAYALVILAEPLIDLGVLAMAKSLHSLKDSGLFHKRLYQSGI